MNLLCIQNKYSGGIGVMKRYSIIQKYYTVMIYKESNSNKKYDMQEQSPYESAKPMYLVDDVDNKENLKEIVIETYKDLSNKKQQKLQFIGEIDDKKI